MTNSYFTNIPVTTTADASILAVENTWPILKVLKKAGAKGLKADEVVHEIQKYGVKPSRSKVYSILKRLKEMNLLHKTFDKEKNAHAYSYSRINPKINQNFVDGVEQKMSKLIEKKLYPTFLEYFEKAILELYDDKKTRHLVPSHGSKSFCTKCNINHEAEEFVEAITSIATNMFLDSDGFKKFAKNNEFADKGFE